MSRRKVTMLEAFQDSARTSQGRSEAELTRSSNRLAPARSAVDAPAEEAPVEPGPVGPGPVSPARSVHDGPAVVPVDEARKARGGAADGAPAGQGGASPAGRGRTSLPMTPIGFVVLQALLLAGAFLVGREVEAGRFGLPGAEEPVGPSRAVLGAASFGVPESGREAPSSGVQMPPVEDEAASGPTSTPSSAAGAAAPAGTDAPGPVDPDTAADVAFLDPAMRFTVLAITYSGTESNEALAWQTYDLLRSKGFPVVKPLERNARIFLFAGASASKADLEGLQDRLRKLKVGPRRTQDFRQAYVVNLKDYRD